MLHNKLQSSELSGSEEEDFLFSLSFYDSIRGAPGGVHFKPGDLPLNKLCNGQLGNASLF